MMASLELPPAALGEVIVAEVIVDDRAENPQSGAVRPAVSHHGWNIRLRPLIATRRREPRLRR